MWVKFADEKLPAEADEELNVTFAQLRAARLAIATGRTTETGDGWGMNDTWTPERASAELPALTESAIPCLLNEAGRTLQGYRELLEHVNKARWQAHYLGHRDWTARLDQISREASQVAAQRITALVDGLD